MKGTIFAAVVLALAAGTAWGDTLQMTFSDTNTSKITSIWYGGQNQNNACINTGAETATINFSPPTTGWNFGASLFYTDLPAVLTTGSGVVQSASLNLRDTWWNNNGFSNVELHRLDSPVAWFAGTGTAGGRWSNPSPYSGAAHYFADFDNLTQTGTTWSGVHVDQWSFNSPSNALETATWVDGLSNTHQVMGDLISVGTLVAMGGCLLSDSSTLDTNGWGNFDATAAARNWANGTWQNTGLVLWGGNAVDLRPGGTMNQALSLTTSSNSGGYQGGLVLTYTTAMAGDATKDGQVDMADYQVWFADFGMSVGATWTQGDFTGDGQVDMADYQIWFANFGAVGGPSSVPEPMTVAMLALALPLIRRRRRAPRIR